VEALAEGIIRVADARMESALRRVSVERGQDPRSFSLLAFGGAGPLHACSLASALGIRSVLIPNAPGALSAIGILDADLRREFSRTVMVAPGSADIVNAFAELEAEAGEAFRGEGASPVLFRSADLRYRGQGFELRIDWSASVRNLLSRFHRQHEQSYGYADAARSVEIVTLRVQAVAGTRRSRLAATRMVKGDGTKARVGSHRIFAEKDGQESEWRRAGLYDRSLLRSGDRLPGPALIVELSATTYLPGGWSATVDGLNNLVLTPEGVASR
jgi:N-methylhydantoinase A